MSNYNKILQERTRLKVWLREDFGEVSEELLPLCCEVETGRPLYLTHVNLALACFPLCNTQLDHIDMVSRAYIYLIALYYIIDALADGHPCHGSSLESDELVSVIPLLEAAALGHFATVGTYYGLNVKSITDKLVEYFSQNRKALGHEKLSRTRPFTTWKNESFHLWARSNCFIFLLDYLASLRKQTLSPALLDALHRLLATIQRGDDSSDWRDDFLRSSYTPFLRRCLVTIDPLIDLNRLEEIIYIEGAMEQELNELLFDYKSIALSLEKIPEGIPLAKLASLQQTLVEKKLESFREIWKLVNGRN